ncbi:MAG: hypothetical protein AAF337_09270 [Pseudomonadota bacterium]
MQERELTIARTLKECIAYVVRDCDEAGFHDAAYHLRRAIEELDHMRASEAGKAAGSAG